MSTLIIQILCGNVLMGTLFVSLFALRQMLKLRRAIDAAFKEQVPESKPEVVPGYEYTFDVGVDTKEYCPGGGGGYCIAGGAGNRVQIFGGAGGNGGSGAGGAYVVVDAGITVLKREELKDGQHS